MPDEKLPWNFKDGNLTIRQKVQYPDGRKRESDYTVLNPNVLKDEGLMKKLIYPDEFKLGNFILSTIRLFRDVGINGLNREMLRRVFIGDDGKLLMSEVVEVGGNEVGGVASVRGREIFEIHNHTREENFPSEGFSNRDLGNFFCDRDFYENGKIGVVVTEGGAYFAVYSPFRRILEKTKNTKIYKRYYRYQNRKAISEMDQIDKTHPTTDAELNYMERELKLEDIEAQMAKKYGYKGVAPGVDAEMFSKTFSNTKRLMLQADLAKAFGIWVYFSPKGDGVARRIA